MASLAHLGLARAYHLAKSTEKARAAYQEFLALWKDADLTLIDRAEGAIPSQGRSDKSRQPLGRALYHGESLSEVVVSQEGSSPMNKHRASLLGLLELTLMLGLGYPVAWAYLLWT
ncbi:MAG: hypothetical protein LAO56_24130 [Acidobacteriia bacterium]|nr:hypothetical protein [Terriglobia bacterium]